MKVIKKRKEVNDYFHGGVSHSVKTTYSSTTDNDIVIR